MKILKQWLLCFIIWILLLSFVHTTTESSVTNSPQHASTEDPSCSQEQALISKDNQPEKFSMFRLLIILPVAFLCLSGLALGHATYYLKPLDGPSYYGLVSSFSIILLPCLFLRILRNNLRLVLIIYMLPVCLTCCALSFIMTKYPDKVQLLKEIFFPTGATYLV